MSQKNSSLFHIQYVEEKFKEVCLKYNSDTKVIDKLFKQVVSAYSKLGRHYHDMNHIYRMVSLWEDHMHLLDKVDEIFFAIIYHDIVYRPLRKDNEEKSADFYAQKIAKNFPGISHDAVWYAILATKHNSESEEYYREDKDIRYLLDFDLEILGTRHESEYEWYRKGVRKEYIIYPLPLYKKGRKAVLESFLNRKSIYLTPEFEKIEKRARKNLKKEINSYLC